jgi:hypothetical protein
MTQPTDLAQAITQEANRYLDRLVTGKCTDWADYKWTTGHIAGLRKAMDIETATINQANNEDNDV